jgi:hypothetical protein
LQDIGNPSVRHWDTALTTEAINRIGRQDQTIAQYLIAVGKWFMARRLWATTLRSADFEFPLIAVNL